SALVSLLVLAVAGMGLAVMLGRQASREKRLHEQAEIARETEQTLRKDSLQVSAEFAARTIANQVDVRWRILEKEAADSQLHRLLAEINAGPQGEAGRGPLQEWLDRRAQEAYTGVPYRTWFIQSR